VSCKPTSNEVAAWVPRLAGRFLVFDGPDGSGKSTQLRRFVDFVREAGLGVSEVRDPGGTAVGERIRELLLDPALEEMSTHCEMLLYMASRAQLVAERLQAARAAGELVVADRFVSSTFAYQGAAGGLEAGAIRRVAEVALEGCWPDLVLIFDVDEATAARRLAGRGARGRYAGPQEPTLFSDRMERKGAEYQRRVREGYLAQAEAAPDRHLVLEAGGDEASVFAELLAALRQRLTDAAESRPGAPEPTTRNQQPTTHN